MSIITPQQAKYYAQLLTSRSVGDRLESLSQSLLSAAVDINPHQVEAALFAFRSPLSKGVVLADEVGLGKTIEAGLVIGQYWAAGKRNIIIVCPAALRKQWSLSKYLSATLSPAGMSSLLPRWTNTSRRM